MSKIQKIAIKYLIIGVAVILIILFAPLVYVVILHLFDVDVSNNMLSLIAKSTSYIKNIIVGLFILFDSIKLVKNKIPISILGFCLPVFGVCFLIIEYYLLQKNYRK